MEYLQQTKFCAKRFRFRAVSFTTLPGFHWEVPVETGVLWNLPGLLMRWIAPQHQFGENNSEVYQDQKVVARLWDCSIPSHSSSFVSQRGGANLNFHFSLWNMTLLCKSHFMVSCEETELLVSTNIFPTSELKFSSAPQSFCSECLTAIDCFSLHWVFGIQHLLIVNSLGFFKKTCL